MPRIPYPDLTQLSDSVRQFIGDKPANVTRMFATASEPVFHSVLAMCGSFINGSSLPAQLREIAILRVGYLSGSAYEVFQHEALARHVGLNEEQINAIRQGGSAADVLGDVGSKVLAYVDDLVLNVRASDATLVGVREHLTDAQLVDLTLVTGAYMMVSRFLETMGVEIDSEAIDWQELTGPSAEG